MTGEELERAIGFLLKNQANFDARMVRLEAAQAETSHQIGELVVSQQGTQQQLDRLTNVVASIAEIRGATRKRSKPW